MIEVENTTPAARDPRPGSEAVLETLAGALPLAAVAAGATWLLELPVGYVLLAVALYAGAAGLLLIGWGRERPGAALGPANLVTLVRSTLVFPLAALLPWAGSLGDPGLWWVIGTGTLALVLDGVDGRVARRTRSASRTGARFDMELDAFLLLSLSGLAWLAGPVGPWVLAIGLLRYLFVAAGAVLPPLRGELPPSRWRQTVCVIQGIALLVAIGPIIPPALANASAGAALLLLLHSFWTDTRWLVRAEGGSDAPASP